MRQNVDGDSLSPESILFESTRWSSYIRATRRPLASHLPWTRRNFHHINNFLLNTHLKPLTRSSSRLQYRSGTSGDIRGEGWVYYTRELCPPAQVERRSRHYSLVDFASPFRWRCEDDKQGRYTMGRAVVRKRQCDLTGRETLYATVVTIVAVALQLTRWA